MIGFHLLVKKTSGEWHTMHVVDDSEKSMSEVMDRLCANSEHYSEWKIESFKNLDFSKALEV